MKTMKEFKKSRVNKNAFAYVQKYSVSTGSSDKKSILHIFDTYLCYPIIFLFSFSWLVSIFNGLHH